MLVLQSKIFLPAYLALCMLLIWYRPLSIDPLLFLFVASQRSPLSAIAIAIAVAQSQSFLQISFSIAFLGITLGATLSPFIWSILWNNHKLDFQSSHLITLCLRNRLLEVG